MFNNPFSMVVAIVLITAIASIYRAKHGLGRRGRGRNAEEFVGQTQPDPEAERMREEIKMLKERIVVLERIATDSNAAVSLDREIEKLR